MDGCGEEEAPTPGLGLDLDMDLPRMGVVMLLEADRWDRKKGTDLNGIKLCTNTCYTMCYESLSIRSGSYPLRQTDA